MTENTRPPLPPFTADTAAQKVQAAENAWNTHDPEKIALAYSIDSQWRNRTEFFFRPQPDCAVLAAKMV